ncbi:MAG: hypothetical protein ABL859_09705 [Methylotenera sp.]
MSKPHRLARSEVPATTLPEHAPNNSFKPTPCRGVGHVLCATLARVRRPATGRLNSGVSGHREIVGWTEQSFFGSNMNYTFPFTSFT